MKQCIFAMVTISSFIMASSCRKNKDDSPSLKGKWNLVSIISREVENGAEVSNDTYNGVPGEIFDFQKNNTLIANFNGRIDIEVYKILENNKVIIGEDTAEIQSLTSSSVRLYKKRIEDVNTFSEFTINLKR